MLGNRPKKVKNHWLMASVVFCFFSSLISSNQRTNFCKFVTKVLNFLMTQCTKLLELYDNFTVRFSPILKETFGQITAKQ